MADLPSNFTTPSGATVNAGSGVLVTPPPQNTTQSQFQANVGSTPAPGSTPPATPAATTQNAAISNGTTSTDVSTLGGPTIGASNLPQSSPQLPPANSMDGLNQILQQQQAPLPAQPQADNISSQISQLTNQLSGKAGDAATLEGQSGIPQMAATARDLSTQIGQLQAQRDQNFQQLAAANKGYGIGSYIDFQNKMTDGELSAKQSAAGATLAAINGNITTAQNLVDRAISQKYDPIKEQIAAYQQQADLVSKTLDRQQQAQLAQQTAKVNAYAAQVAVKSAQANRMLEAIVTASANSSNPAPAYIASQAHAAALSNDPTSALAIIAPYLTDPNAVKLQLADIAAKKASASASYADAAYKNAQTNMIVGTNPSTGLPLGVTGNAAINTASPGYSTAPVVAGLTQASIDQKALSYLTSGTQPPQGRTGVAGAQSAAISNRMAEMAPGGNLQGNKAQLKANTESLTKQTEYFNNTNRAFNTANDTLASLQTFMTANNINPSQFPDYNSFSNYIKSKGLDPGAAGGYNAQIATLRSEYSQVLAKGGVRSEGTDREAAALIPSNLAPAQLAQVAVQIKIDGGNAVSDAQKQVSQIQDKINSIVAPASSAPSSGGAVKLQDPKTGEVRSFTLSPTDLQDALSKGYKQI